MIIWDIIRDWFVVYVWGGYTSNGILYKGLIGANSNGNIFSSDLNFTIGNIELSLGDYLSTTSTLITLGLMCFGFYLIIRYMFRLTAGLIRGH